MRTGNQPQRAEEVLIARMRLHIQILDQIRVVLDELPPRLNLIAHQQREDFIRRQKRDQRMLKDQADIIAEQADEIAKLQAQIESLKKSL